jgi:hypothetical protein
MSSSKTGIDLTGTKSWKKHHVRCQKAKCQKADVRKPLVKSILQRGEEQKMY